MTNKIRKSIFLVVLLLLGLILAGCKNKIVIEGPKKVAVGSTISLTINEEDAAHAIWTSSDESIATVSNGIVTGLKVGTVDISASIGERSGKISIKVSENVNNGEKLFCAASIVSENVNAYDKIELSLMEKVPGTIVDKYNPFDYNAIYVYGVFTSPSGKSIKMPAFWYRDYTINLNTSMSTGKAKAGEPDGTETVNWIGDYEYRLRFLPDEAGEWTYKIYSKIGDDGALEELTGKIDVEGKEEDYKGFIQVDKSNNRTFIYEDGSTFMPIGENMGWWANDSRKTYDYYVWFENAHKNNMNIARIWMMNAYNPLGGFCLHWGKSIYDLTDRLGAAARLDKVIEYADQFDIYIMLTLINHGQFSSEVNSVWASNPYNKAKGGILDKPEKFFSDKEAKKVYKNELMYIIGRYGYSDHIMCWELFNEVDWTDNSSLNSVNIKNWHKEMAMFINANDPYNHMISTSYKSEYGLAFTLDEIDFVCPHSYGYAGLNICDALPSAMEKIYSQYKKPVLYAEIGIDWENGNNNYRLDPKGISLRQASWAGMLGGGASGAMNWWWDSYVHPYDLYSQFSGAGAYAKLLNLHGSDYTQLRTLQGVNVPSNVGIIGYRFDDRIYGYVYAKQWRYNNIVSDMSEIDVSIPFTDGSYKVIFYDTLSGTKLSEKDVNVAGGNISFTLPEFNGDIAFIVNK